MYEKKHTWLRPLVAPRDARLGDASDMKIKTAPKLRQLQVVGEEKGYKLHWP